MEDFTYIKIELTPLMREKLGEFGLSAPSTTLSLPSSYYDYHKSAVETQFHSEEPEDIKEAIAIARAYHEFLDHSNKPSKEEYVQPKEEKKESYKTHLRIIITLLLAILVLLLCQVAKGQSNGIILEVQQTGTRQRLFAGGIARLNCGSGMTCAWDGVNGRVNISATGTGGVGGTGTTNILPLWNSSTALGDSALSQTSGNLTATGTFTATNLYVGTPLASTTGYIEARKTSQSISATNHLGVYVEVGNTTNKFTAAGWFNAYNNSNAGTTGTVVGVYGNADAAANGTVTNLYGLYYTTSNSSGSATVTNAYGNFNTINQQVGGTITNASILAANLGVNSGTITTLKGLDLGGWTGGGTVTTSYGIYADNTIDVGSTKYFIYSTSASPSLITGQVTLSANPILSAQTANRIPIIGASKDLTNDSTLTWDTTEKRINLLGDAGGLYFKPSAFTAQWKIYAQNFVYTGVNDESLCNPCFNESGAEATQPIFGINFEPRYYTGSPPNGLLEVNWNFYGLAGVNVAGRENYRPYNFNIDLNNNQATHQFNSYRFSIRDKNTSSPAFVDAFPETRVLGITGRIDMTSQDSTQPAFHLQGDSSSSSFVIYQPTAIAAGAVTYAFYLPALNNYVYGIDVEGSIRDGLIQTFKNTSANANAVSRVEIESAGSDPSIRLMDAGGANNISLGMDKSDSNSFKIDVHYNVGSNTALKIDTSLNTNLYGNFFPKSVAFASLGTPSNGALVYCSDCLANSNPCSGSSTGAMAKRLNGAWDCR